MILIVDVNVVISALIRDSKSRELLIFSPFTFYSPDTLLESVNKYGVEIMEKSGMTKKEFEILLNFLLERIKIVKREDYMSRLGEANETIGHVDVEDVPFIALALSMESDGIWSDDTHFQKQNKIKILRTEDVVREFESLNE